MCVLKFSHSNNHTCVFGIISIILIKVPGNTWGAPPTHFVVYRVLEFCLCDQYIVTITFSLFDSQVKCFGQV